MSHTDPVIEALSSNALAALEQREPPIQLAFWPSDERAMPEDFIACALFTASKVTRHVTAAELACINGLTVIFTGKRLTQAHADVWMGIMHLARQQNSGDRIRFRDRDLLKLIGRYTHQNQRKQLRHWIYQLQSTSLVIQEDKRKQRYGGSLLPNHEETDAAGQTHFVVELSRQIVRIFENRALVNWEIRRALQKKPLALWLQTFFSRFTRPVRVDQLHALSGSSMKLKMFRFQLARALDELHAAGGYSAEIDKATDIVRASNLRQPPKPKAPRDYSGQELLFREPLRLVK